MGVTMTRLLKVSQLSKETGLPYRLCLQLVRDGDIPSLMVGRRRRVDIRWLEQWLATGGYVSSTLPLNQSDVRSV